MSDACWSRLSLCGTQFNRLDCDGNVLTTVDGDGLNVIVTCGLVDATRTEIVGDDQTIRDPNGSGGYCAQRVKPAKVEGYEWTFTLCSKMDAELMELMGLTDRVIDPVSGDTLGFKARDLTSENCDCAPTTTCTDPGVSMLLWSLAWCGDDPHPVYKYSIEAIPRIYFKPGAGTRTVNSEFTTYTISGTGRPNDNWGTGPGTVYPEPAGLDRHWAEWLTNTPYPGGCNCGCGATGTCGYLLTGAAVVPLGG